MQNLGQICRFLWAKLWTYGQNRGQILGLIATSQDVSWGN